MSKGRYIFLSSDYRLWFWQHVVGLSTAVSRTEARKETQRFPRPRRRPNTWQRWRSKRRPGLGGGCYSTGADVIDFWMVKDRIFNTVRHKRWECVSKVRWNKHVVFGSFFQNTKRLAYHTHEPRFWSNELFALWKAERLKKKGSTKLAQFEKDSTQFASKSEAFELFCLVVHVSVFQRMLCSTVPYFETYPCFVERLELLNRS